METSLPGGSDDLECLQASRSGTLHQEGEHSLSDILLIGEGCTDPHVAEREVLLVAPRDGAVTEWVTKSVASAGAIETSCVAP